MISVNIHKLIEDAIKQKCRECFQKQIKDAEDAVFVEEQPSMSDDSVVHSDSDIPWGEETSNDL